MPSRKKVALDLCMVTMSSIVGNTSLRHGSKTLLHDARVEHVFLVRKFHQSKDKVKESKIAAEKLPTEERSNGIG